MTSDPPRDRDEAPPAGVTTAEAAPPPEVAHIRAPAWQGPAEWATRVINDNRELARFLGSPPNSFTEELFVLMNKANRTNLELIAETWPREVAAYRAWQESDHPPTWGELAKALADKEPTLRDFCLDNGWPDPGPPGVRLTNGPGLSGP